LTADWAEEKDDGTFDYRPRPQARNKSQSRAGREARLKRHCRETPDHPEHAFRSLPHGPVARWRADRRNRIAITRSHAEVAFNIQGSSFMSNLTAAQMEKTVRTYMAACTAGDADGIAATLTEDALHFFPPDMYDGPWKGGRYIADRWAEFVRNGHSSWTVDELAIDPTRRRVAAEWTHFKGKTGVILRGAEWYEFDDSGLIKEIRAYYASPQAKSLDRLELGGFDYAGRGYPMTPPAK
jgi:hypothetical protein